MRTALILALATLLATTALAAERPSDLDRKIESFEQRTGVDLHIVGDRTERGVKGPPKRKQARVDPLLAVKLLPALEDILMVYSDEVRGGMLKDLYLIGKLKIRGKPFLGAAYPKDHSFDLAIRSGTNAVKVRRTMHHEVAHLIENSSFFPVETWKAFAPGGYIGREPGKSWANGKSGMADARRAGFATRYASKNRHEDFAELAELAFISPKQARKLGGRYPLLGDKLRLMTDVYRKVAPGMKLPWTTSMKIAQVPSTKRTSKG